MVLWVLYRDTGLGITLVAGPYLQFYVFAVTDEMNLDNFLLEWHTIVPADFKQLVNEISICLINKEPSAENSEEIKEGNQ